jgi:hypothetical protein
MHWGNWGWGVSSGQLAVGSWQWAKSESVKICQSIQSALKGRDTAASGNVPN